MSNFKCEVVRIEKFARHPNADTLSITNIEKNCCIFRTEDFKRGDKAVFVPIDAVVPENDSRFVFLQGKTRIKAKKLRGIFSTGILIPADPSWEVGQDVKEILGVKKWEEPEPICTGGENERDPGFMPTYTDIENYRSVPDIFREGEDVVITEKLHGTNYRVCYKDGRLWVGSHRTIKKQDSKNLYWRAAIENDLVSRLSGIASNHVFFGEIFGSVQDIKYGAKQGQIFVRFFDVYDVENGKYLDYDAARSLVESVGLTFVPVLYEGPWRKDLLEMAEKKSVLADNISEGLVIKPTVERWDQSIGRVVLKYVSEQYLLRKHGTEHK